MPVKCYIEHYSLGLHCPTMKDAKQIFADRLKQSMQAIHLEPIPSVLEREFNQRNTGDDVTLHGVRKWLLGESIPVRRNLEILESWLKADFLSFRPATTNQRSATQNHRNWRAELSTVEREAVDIYLALPVQQRKIVREVILAFARTASVA